jgi:peptidoglycan/xylan/chitin deacetylase (PgdA/CDA1 family)
MRYPIAGIRSIMTEKKLSRRKFLKVLAFLGTGTALSKCASDRTGNKNFAEQTTLADSPGETPSPSIASVTESAETATSTVSPTPTHGCTPLGLTDAAKDFIAAHEVKRGDTSRNVMLMTYDDMNYHEYFTWILDAYKSFGAKTTFFLPGGYYRDFITIKKYASEIERIVAEGHVFGCHGLVHEPLTSYTSDQIRKDIEQWLKLAGEIVPGYSVQWIRFPFGDSNDRILKIVAEYGLQSVLWSYESGGMDEATLSRLLEKTKPGDIVLSHSMRYYDAFYAHDIIEKLLSSGYSLESVETGLAPEDYLPSGLNPNSCR